MKKKLTAFLLVLAMIISSVSPAFAADDFSMVGLAESAESYNGAALPEDAGEPAEDAEWISDAAETVEAEDQIDEAFDAAAYEEPEEDFGDAPEVAPGVLDESDEMAVPGDESGLSVPEIADEDVVTPSDESGISAVEAAEPDESSVAASEAEFVDEELTGASSLLANGSTVYVRSSLNSGYVVTIASGSRANKANVELRANSKGENQMFTLHKLSNGNYVFYNFKSSKAFGPASQTPTSGLNVHQYEYLGFAHQQWKAVANSDGTYTFLNAANTNLALTVNGTTAKNGVNIKVATKSNSKSQKFTLASASFTTYSGSITLRPSSKSSMAEMIASASTSSGANVYLGASKGSNAQIFTLQRSWGGYYLLKNVNSGMVLGTAGQAKTAGTYVNQYTKQGFKYQLWKPVKNSDGTYTFFSRLHSEMVLDAGGTASKTRLRIAKYTGSANQKFVTSVPTASDATSPAISAQIRSAYNTDRCANLTGNYTTDNANIQLFDWNNHVACTFKFVPVTFKGKTNVYCKIQTSCGKVLDVAGGTAAQNANIRQMPWTGSRGQIWRVNWNSDGTASILSTLNGNYCLSISSATDKIRTNIVLALNKGKSYQKWYICGQRITSCKINTSDNSTVAVASSGAKPQSDDGKAYLFAVEPYLNTVSGSSPLASSSLGTSMSFTTKLNKNTTASVLQKKFYIAVKYKGAYRITSNGFYITNPQYASTRTTAFPSPSRGTKKGLKTTLRTVDINQAKALNCSHVVLDFPIETFLSGSGYSYQYEGKTYNFSTAILSYKNLIKNYSSSGIVVSGIFYLSNRTYTQYILPSAVSGAQSGKGVIFALNTANSNRKKLEALFACLADEWTKDGCMVANWIYGNETDQYITYNYSGEISYDQYHEAYADAFRMFNASIKSRWRYARTYISLDHNWGFPNTESWTKSYRTYPGLYLTQDFHKDLQRQGGIHWDMAMHPYPSPEQDCKVWIGNSAVTNSGTSKQVTPLNMRYFAAYIKKTYGSGTHIIMSESGLSSKYGTVNQEEQQAAAVAYSYYLTQFDSNIDMYGYHREMDKSAETAGGWWLGLYYADGSETYKKPKKSADVFKYMDTKSYSSHVSTYMKKYLGSTWTSKIPNWKPSIFK